MMQEAKKIFDPRLCEYATSKGFYQSRKQCGAARNIADDDMFVFGVRTCAEAITLRLRVKKWRAGKAEPPQPCFR
jgi:hypothetical protein